MQISTPALLFPVLGWLQYNTHSFAKPNNLQLFLLLDQLLKYSGRVSRIHNSSQNEVYSVPRSNDLEGGPKVTKSQPTNTCSSEKGPGQQTRKHSRSVRPAANPDFPKGLLHHLSSPATPDTLHVKLQILLPGFPSSRKKPR